MQDFVPLGTGNSRYLKSVENFKTLYPTYDAFVAALVAGTLPIDFNGINEAGIAQKGNPINKNTLLKDPTAEAFGVGIGAVPDDVLRVLSRFQKGLGNEYVWAKNTLHYKVTEGQRVDLGVTTPSNTSTVQISDTIEVVDGVIKLVDPVTYIYSSGSNSTIIPALKGKYFIHDQLSPTTVYKDADSYAAMAAISWAYYPLSVVEEAVAVGYVNSPDPNAYPPAVDDGYTYTALGMLGEKVRIATGSYTGTGNHNSGSPNSLTFDFEPKLIIIRSDDAYKGQEGSVIGSIFVRGSEIIHYNLTYGMYSSYIRKITWSGNTVSWYTDSGYPADQLNSATAVYNYVAIG